MVFHRTGGYFPVGQLRNEMDRLVSDFFGPASAAGPARWSWASRNFPALNVWEEGDALWAEAEVPGLKGDDLDISVVGGDLTIRGSRGEAKQEGVAYHRQERGTGEFNRVLRLPQDVDPSGVEATLTDGVLRIKLPKAESAKPREIKISNGK